MTVREMTLDHLQIASLKPDPHNARLHPKRQVQQLAKSIRTFGFNCPVLIDREHNVVAGHGRLLAAQFLGWTEVPTLRLDHLTPAQVRAYRIADNRLTDCSTWDDQLLAEQLQELALADLDFDLTAIGFELPEIDLRIQSLSLAEAEPTVDATLLDKVAVTRRGDVWQLGEHRLACGDALDADVLAAVMGGQRAHMVFSDPPYNVPVSGHVMGKGKIKHAEFAMASGEMSADQFTAFLTDAIGGMTASLESGALLYLCMDWRHLVELSSAARLHALELKNLCIWDKGNGGMGAFYRSQHELVFVFRHGGTSSTNNVQLGRFGRNRTNVWHYPGVNTFARNTSEGNLLAMHPTCKPIALVADALLDASHRGQRVLDPFMGSGTTLLAAERTGRIAHGIELDSGFVDLAVRRWQALTGEHAVLAGTGEVFSDIERVLEQRAGTPAGKGGEA
jgi:DNA modification methylase